MQRRAYGNQGGVGFCPAHGLYPGQAQGGLNRDAIVLLYLVHRNRQGAHLVFANIVEAQMQGQALGGRLEDQLVNAQLFNTGFQVFRHPQVVKPVGDGNFQNVRCAGALTLRQVKGQLTPHIGQLEIVGAKEKLPRVEGAARGITDLPVGLNDGLSGLQTFP